MAMDRRKLLKQSQGEYVTFVKRDRRLAPRYYFSSL